MLVETSFNQHLNYFTPDMLAHITPRGISALPGPVVKLQGNFTLLTPDMLSHITPRGISALSGPVVKLL